jgi:glucokinase
VQRIGQAVARAVDEAGLKSGEVAYAGLGTPGTMDIPRGMLLTPGNLPGWWNFPIRDRVSHHSGLRVAYANDANAAAYGEFWVGRGRDFHSLVLFTLGTGVGSGIIIGDLSIDGENSAGGELGHMIIDYNETSRPCTCGQSGHMEAYASATAVVKRTHAAITAGKPTSLAARMKAGEELTALMVAEEAERDDALALEIVLETGRYVGIGVVNAMHCVDPSGVIIGGAMTFGEHESRVGQRFLKEIQDEVRRRALAGLADKTVIDFAQLGGDAGYIGAAGIGRLAHRRG